eukprot:CAMPEP_0175075524 /NCGR_PEP_ID=MMETSP0052_2-20121109/22066_1 /TAXON_ID=51329 ORGANISM="Polytomella parva, Strain SAG 63-3" /NCGR_SAMPLE_ID=MMETSP0052_2 /ASSEMBLY_ACC=CAM_ASM_000194 /LENGTH=810 /DNA_ID=CAMNT_0016344255 /DNA_START=338 /DNA_END=2773 /DNA_ORIENTATION=+
MDISPDGQLLATLSADDPVTKEQEVALWSMSDLLNSAAPDVRPIVSTSVPAGDVQTTIRFNMNRMDELISNGKRRVYFWTWVQTTNRFKFYSPPLRSKDFKQSVGDFVTSTFVPGTPQALTGTTDGDIVVWDEQGIAAQMGTSATDRRAIKLMRIHNMPITFLSTIGHYIVSGGEDGFVRFFDPLLRIVAWFEDLAAGPIASIAFSNVLPERLANVGAAETLNRFIVPDFIVATRENRFLSVPSGSFEEFDASKRTGRTILDTLIANVMEIVAHPAKPELVALGRNGTIQQWDSLAHLVTCTRQFSNALGATAAIPGSHVLKGQTVAYSRNGAFLVVGFHNGQLNVVDSKGFTDIHSARNTSAPILKVAVSANGTHIAAADAQDQVILYAYLAYRSQMRWEFVGKCKSHYAPIVSLTFGESPSGGTRLFSVGSDRRMVEYDLMNTKAASVVTANNGLRLLSYLDFPSGVSPTAMCFAPPLQYFKHFSADTQLLISDESYKVRIFNPDLGAMAATFLGPTFGQPIRQMILFKAFASDGNFIAFHTGHRVLGLISWPLQGDPSQTVGLIAHPGRIVSVAVSFDGRKLLSAGDDGIVAMWDVTTRGLEAAAARRAKEMATVTPAAGCAAAAKLWEAAVGDPEVLKDLQDYFYYSELKAQGEDTLEPRKITGMVPLVMVPDLMRAAGFYPSEADIQNLLNHVTYMAQQRDVDKPEEVSFNDLLCLYVNHRPLNNVTIDDITAAFKAINARGNPLRIENERLKDMLLTGGEAMGVEELAAALKALTGAETLNKVVSNTAVNVNQFSEDILGFENS